MILQHKFPLIFYKKHTRRMPVNITLRKVKRTFSDILLRIKQYMQHRPKPRRAGKNHVFVEYELLKSIKATDRNVPGIPYSRLCFSI